MLPIRQNPAPRTSPIAARPGDLTPFLRRLGILVGLAVGVTLLGTAGFALTEGASIWQGFVRAVDTITTVGASAEPEGVDGQIVKLALILLGVGVILYTAITLAEFFVVGQLSELLAERRTLRRVAHLADHHIVCGFGRVGRQVARDLKAAGHPIMVVDTLPENQERAADMGVPFLLATPSDDEALREAGIERARSVLACVDDDAENIFICLTARELRSEITIVARASLADSEKKLLRAGANRVISPYKSSGAEMARLAQHPQVAGVVDVAPEWRMEEIEVTAGCEGEGETIGDVRGTAAIAALREPDGRVQPQPSSSTVLRPGDVLIAMGTTESLARLEHLFTPAREPQARAG